MIRLRERLLNRALSVNPSPFLNSPALSLTAATAAARAGDLKGVLNRLKGEAVTADGRWVNYSRLAESPIYQEYRVLAASLMGFDYRSLNAREEKLAFWINLYNALVIDAVIQEKVRVSLTENPLGVLGFFQKAAYQVNGQRFSLADIEHGVLRANRGFPYFPGPHFEAHDPRVEAALETMDPRIHFALNCASRSCPPIRIYHPDQIYLQLDLAARSFINADSVIDEKRKTISISRIFRWYAVDFGGKDGVINLLTRYLEVPENGRPIPGKLANFRLIYHPYDWGLNTTNPGI